MIINTGCRTDIPAYFSKWFLNRIKEGFVYVRNPYYKNQVTRYVLNPEVVDCIAFCTKNPEPLYNRIHELDDYRMFWFVTITPYGKEIEPYVPDKDKVIDSFIKLSKTIGSRKIKWRYDPIFINERYTVESHVRAFENIASKLCGYTDDCIISFIDLYEKTKKNFHGIEEVTKEQQIILAKEFVKIGRKYNININTCVEGRELEKYGVNCDGCMTKNVIEHAIDVNLNIPKKKGARDGCDCVLGNDIGAYNTCGHGCIYCYANYDRKTVINNFKLHDPESPFLIGGSMDGDVVKDAKQQSFIENQISWF